MNLDKSRPYSEIKSLDVKNKVCFAQDGVDYDREGNPLNPKQVKKFLDTQAASIQEEADVAMEIAKEAAATAKEKLAALKKTN